MPGSSPRRKCRDHHGLLVSRRRAWLSFSTLALAIAWAGFTIYKAQTVAKELVDPPFYQPQPLSRVEATYAALAKGGEGDPGGTWASAEVGTLQLWTLRRAHPAPGIVLLLHGFGDDRWGTSPALKWFPTLDAAIFTYRRRDDALRKGGPAPAVTFGAEESKEVVQIVHHLERAGIPRERVLLMGRSLGASVGLLALAKLEAERQGPLAGFIWEGAPASSQSFGERLIRGPKDRFWHPLVAPLGGWLGSRWAGSLGGYAPAATDLTRQVQGPLKTPSLCFLATQDRLADPEAQRLLTWRFDHIQTVGVDTWHLNCAQVLGPGYAKAIQGFTAKVFPNEKAP